MDLTVPMLQQTAPAEPPQAPAPAASDSPAVAPPVQDEAPPQPPRDVIRFDAPQLVPARPVDAPVAAAPTLAPAAPTCQTFGTSLQFAVSPAAAEKQAAQDDKLMFLLHVSGDFEDDAFT
jgi:hypothetical protein